MYMTRTSMYALVILSMVCQSEGVGKDYIYQTNGAATLIVLLPKDAKLTLNGAATTAKGTRREFETPPLKEGVEYEYKLVATLDRGDRRYVIRTKIPIKADTVVQVNLNDMFKKVIESDDLIEAALERAKLKDWPVAVEALQKVLDTKSEGSFYVDYKTHRGDDGQWWTGMLWPAGSGRGQIEMNVREEANRVIATLPSDGLEFYELSSGTYAKTLLSKWRKTRDIENLAEAASRFAHTEAGCEATRLLADHYLDRAQYSAATKRYGDLFNLVGNDKMPVESLAKWYIAARMVEDESMAGELYGWLQERGPFRFSGNMMTVGDFKQYVDTVRQSR